MVPWNVHASMNVVDSGGMIMSELALPVGTRDHIRGNQAAPVTLVEYGDFECPFCKQAFYVVKRIQEEAGDRMRFIFRSFPLTRVHDHALHTALAAEAAGFQGAFWDMHDILFEHQEALDDESLVVYATSLELDVPKFIDDLKSEAAERQVQEDFKSGIRSGVNGTPTFFINGRRHDHWYQYEALHDAVMAAAGAARR